ncbi:MULTISPECIES: non-ribosomal peptide synthetase [Paenibacillus]|uniref:non-ribosomal peptide synthetase n=1 Tax=Paenibacillus TaxID=44249 RepID=UPI0022B8D490|nr:non-ribosomal peptide synthetase [Paenibacillus caseinilyticus]MCZ8521355.1 amino acid adenylation domain-containing protein [Paenibacillus caseinilyticus]
MVNLDTDQIEDLYPMSDIQQGMVFYSLRHSGQSLYHEQFVYQLREPGFERLLFQRALELLVQKHSILRTSFHFDLSDSGIQIVHRKVDVQVEDHDWRLHSKEEQEQRLQQSLSEDRSRPFSMAEAPLWRAKLYRLDDAHYAFGWMFHHSILDGWSAASFITELVNTYLGLKADAHYAPPALKCTYKDYIVDLMLFKENMEAASYWKRELEDFKRLELPWDEPSADQLRKLHFELDGALQVRIEQLSRELRIPVRTICFAAYVSMAYMLTCDGDVLVGLVESNRPLIRDGDRLLGCFLNTIPFRFQVDSSLTWEGFLRQVDRKLTELKLYGRLPLTDIIGHADAGAARASENPLFDTYFNYIDFHIYDQVDRQADVRPLLDAEGYENTNTWLDFAVSHARNQLSCTISYKHMSEHTVEQLSGYFLRSLEEMTEQASGPIRKERMLPAGMTQQLLSGFNRTLGSYPQEQTIQGLFEEQARRTPDRTAIICGGEELTYGELNRRANRLARALRARGVRADHCVGLMASRSPEMVTGLLAILKAGGAYVPIDPAYPDDRIRYMLEDSGAGLLLTQNHLMDRVSFAGEKLDAADPQWLAGEASDLPSSNDSAHLAYVIYTSGSTGQPKGVMIEHRSVVNFLYGMKTRLGLGTGHTFLSLTTVSFDIFALELFLPLLFGMKAVIAEEEEIRELRLQELAVRHGVDVVQTTPSRWQSLLQRSDVSWLGAIKKILIGGEASTPELINELRSRTDAQLFNVYGPTETTIWSTASELKGDQVRIGSPIMNTQVYILGAGEQLQPVGAAGELYIGGDGVARGYVNRPDLTAEKFTLNPHVPGGRMYRTGDLARWLPDGELEYLGRIDGQVKIRGYRIETGEIEAKLLAHSAIREAAVTAFEEGGGRQALCAYITAAPGQEAPAPAELRTCLARSLPEYMLPAAFVAVERLPLTPSGKLDRRALPRPHEQWSGRAAYAAPRDQREAALARIWQELLGVERVGLHDHFFELGGHSLKAMSLAARIHKEMHVEAALRDLFAHPTLEEMASHLGRLDGTAHSAIPQVPEQPYYTVSSAQQRLYVLAQLEDLQTSYNMPGVFRLSGAWDRARLAEAFAGMIERHEALRTSFGLVNGEPVQYVHPAAAFELEELKPGPLRSALEWEGTGNGQYSRPTGQPLPASYPHASHTADSELELYGQIARFIRPFDLSRAPLLRAGLLPLPGGEAILFVDLHHIVSDGVSMDVLVREWLQLYNGETLPPLRVQYKDYAAWQREQLQGERLKRQEAYWLDALGGELPVLGLPLDLPRPALQSFEGGRARLVLPQELTRQLKALCAREGVTLSMLLLAGFQVLLSRYSGQEDVIVGVPAAGRPHADLERVLGMFVHTLPMRGRPEGVKTFLQFLQEVKAGALEAYEHQDYPFEQVVERLNLPRDLSRNPVFDVMFVMQNAGQGGPLETPAGVSITPLRFENPMSKFDLTLQAVERIELETVELELEYAAKLIFPATAERILRNYEQLLGQIVHSPEMRLAELELLTAEEWHLLLERFNDTAAEYPREQTIHGLFEEQAERTPDRIAVVMEQEQLTYRELNERANRLARALRGRGVQADTLVGVLAERSPEMVIGILAVLKAGGAFVPVDPSYPEERIRFMLADCGARHLLAGAESLRSIPASYEGEVLELGASAVLREDAGPAEPISGPRNLLYVIYTSGTTGQPKGVMLEHRNLVNLICHQRTRSSISFHGNVLQSTSISFDVCYQEIFSTLLSGGTLHIVDQETKMSPSRLLSYIQKHRIQVMLISASYSKVLFGGSLTPDLPSVSDIVTAGEQLILSDSMITYLKRSGIRLHNHYGPSETHVVTTYTMDPGQPMEEIPPIGQPIQNTRVLIVSPELRLVPLGVVGELCVSGDAVGRGYLNRPDITEERFISHPDLPGERMYRTGDLARWLPDGTLEYAGRRDHQVKIRGHRIEIGEIESKLLEVKGIREAVVLALGEADGQKALCAYFAVHRDEELPPAWLRTELAGSLPDYMIPTHFVQLERLPLTLNGKIDRGALPAPDHPLLQQHTAAYEAPGNGLEEALAAIWQDLLDVERIGVHDDFFELGGHSLKAIQAVELARQQQLPLSLKELMELRTIRAAAEHMRREPLSEGLTAAAAEHPVGAQRRYNPDFVRPADYPYYYPCSVGAVLEKLRYERNLQVPKSFLTNARGDGVLFYKYGTKRPEDRITYHSSQARLGELMGFPPLLEELGVSFGTRSFEEPDEAISWCEDKLSRKELVILSGSTYYLPYTPEYRAPQKEFLDILDRSSDEIGIGRTHIYVLVDMTEHECIVYDSSYQYFGPIGREEFIQSFGGIGRMTFIDHPAQNTVVPYQVIEVHTDAWKTPDGTGYGEALLRAIVEAYLHAPTLELEEKGVPFRVVAGLDAITHLIRTIGDSCGNPELLPGLSEFMCEMGNAWKYKLHFLADLIQDLQELLPGLELPADPLNEGIHLLGGLSLECRTLSPGQWASNGPRVQAQLSGLHSSLQDYFLHLKSVLNGTKAMAVQKRGS